MNNYRTAMSATPLVRHIPAPVDADGNPKVQRPVMSFAEYAARENAAMRGAALKVDQQRANPDDVERILLKAIGKFPGKTITQLTEITGLAKGTVQNKVLILERKGDVKRFRRSTGEAALTYLADHDHEKVKADLAVQTPRKSKREGTYRAILAVLSEAGDPLRAVEVADLAGMHAKTARRGLDDLAIDGKVQRRKANRDNAFEYWVEA